MRHISAILLQSTFAREEPRERDQQQATEILV